MASVWHGHLEQGKDAFIMDGIYGRKYHLKSENKIKQHHLYFVFSLGATKKFRTLGNSFNATTTIPSKKSKTWCTIKITP